MPMSDFQPIALLMGSKLQTGSPFVCFLPEPLHKRNVVHTYWAMLTTSHASARHQRTDEWHPFSYGRCACLSRPKRFRNYLFATKLRNSPIDCHSSHDRNKSVLLLTAVHVEHGLECTPHNHCFLFGAKLVYKSGKDRMQTYAERRNIDR